MALISPTNMYESCSRNMELSRSSPPSTTPRGTGKPSTNKTLIRILSRTMHDHPKTWHEQLPMALWAYRTAPRSSTSVSLYSLVYGADAVLLAEIKIPTARIAASSGVHWNEVEASSSRIAELDVLDSRRDKAVECPYAITKAYNTGYYKIIKEDGGKLETVINGKWLKAYYA
ncbi:uncharacterized protein LOC113290781 [Papaver somniferum]|uniref:uncharacterized protein LOC113290781 n=1 Tax=Papaver somniferum TaxID=3469 RepID=UPI000E705350|nr:uncharacterized protein LOC113290781 [Papaver somniferum]